jgi:TonB family protein
MKKILTLITLLSVSLPTLADEALEAILETAQLTVSAKQINQIAPTYPMLDLRKGREAWVHVTYCIDEVGAVQNVSILDSVGNERFDQAAINTVEEWEFEPALQNGKPAWQSRNNVLIHFAIEDAEHAASRKFFREYRKIGEFIDENDLKAADDLFWKVYQDFDLSLYELAKLWAQRVRYESKTGDMYKLNMALHRATASHGEWIDEQSYVQLLNIRAQVELRLGKYHAAKRSYEDLADIVGHDAERVMALSPTFEKLHESIASNQTLRINAEVRSRGDCAFCNDSWDFTPVRNDFAFGDIKGKLHTIDMRCDNQRFQSDVLEQVEWHIPEKWGTCHVQVYGEPETTFAVLMLPPTAD